MFRPRTHESPRASRGFTLIELTIALAIGAALVATAMTSLNALTNAGLRSAGIEITGAIKQNYDRSVMLRRTQRIAMNIDSGVWWVDYTEDKYALSVERAEGTEGDKPEEDEKEKEDSIFGSSIFDDDVDPTVKNALEGSAAIRFIRDEELSQGQTYTLPPDVCFSRVWTAHQEEPFKTGIAYLHFFPGGWTEAARIELIDRPCDDKPKHLRADDDSFLTLRVLPLTGRVRTAERMMKEPNVSDWDGRDQGDL